MKKWIIILVVFIAVTIGFFLWHTDEQNLGDGYFFLPKYEAIDIGFPDGAIIYKSEQKYLFNDIKIRHEVIDVESNDQFIIAIRKLEGTIATKYSLEYYIIDKEIDSVFGPYNLTEFNHQSIQLMLPKDLKFD